MIGSKVLCGVFPISRVAAIPFCVHRISQLLPLERILALTHPSTAIEPAEDKRTWRDGRRSDTKTNADLKWTAIDIMTAYAKKKGWVTAKAGRPDINRAGNASEPVVALGSYMPLHATSAFSSPTGIARKYSMGILAPSRSRG